ncbi:MAG: hypothetical protein ACKOD7_06560 [Polynucleobacter victoriensis]
MSLVTVMQFKTHAVKVTHHTATGRVICFKFDNQKCDIECFEDYDQAADYILEPFPIYHYEVVVRE